MPSKPHRYVAFMRALNVGGRIVKMDLLRKLFEELGFTDVATYIASGNVIFHSPETDTGKLERTINAHLEESLGYVVGTYIRTPAELATIAAHRPFPDAELDAPGHTLYINFLPRSRPPRRWRGCWSCARRRTISPCTAARCTGCCGRR